MPDPAVDASAASGAGELRFLTFRSGGGLYALPAQDVAEVMRVPAMARVPQGPAALLGIAKLRGAVLPVASLQALLGRGQQALPATARAVVLDIGAPVALVVDAVDALISIAPDRIETREAELGAEPGERLSGAFQSAPGRPVAKILDIKSLIDAAFAQRTRPQRQARQQLGAGAERKNAAGGAGAAGEMLVTFEVAGQEFALGLDTVQEIVPAPQTFAAVPRAEALVLGVTTLRNALLPLLSLRGLLGFPPAPMSEREKVVVMKVGGAQVGLVADRARAIVAAAPSLVDAIPPVLAARTGGESRIRAIYRGDAGKRLVSILAPEQLFREEVMQRLAAARATSGSQAGDEEKAVQQDELIFLVFRLGEDEFGLPIATVDEVAQVPAEITRVPRTPDFLEGVINLRGDVLPVVDQRRRFDMPKSADTAGRRLVVVRTERHRAGLIVDGVSDVLRVSGGAVEPAPDLTDDTARLVSGVINLEETGRMVLLLDPTELLTRAERGLLDAFQEKESGAA
jgi:purine-binding chemotaxis protein CheW